MIADSQGQRAVRVDEAVCYSAIDLLANSIGSPQYMLYTLG